MPSDKPHGRTLRFVATSALVVAPLTVAAGCGGAAQEATNVDAVDETSNMAEEAEDTMEGTNVDHTNEPHTNVGPEEEEGGDEGAGGGA